jgi:redox-sensitive bicupin YhaK (pirin superfamily)
VCTCTTGAIELVVEARVRDLPSLSVRRTLPTSQRRHVGPFVFLDHMGPVSLGPGVGLDIPPHPHIGLATVTYLFDGEILHRDSLGSEVRIRPGDVNWMSAGRGIVHSERTPLDLRQSTTALHGLQAWVALPREHEESYPTFQHHPAATIPLVHRPGVELRVVAGRAYGATSPVEVLSPLFYVQAELDAGAELELPDEPERAAHVVAGSLACEGGSFGPGTLLVFRAGASGVLRAATAARVALLGGAPLDGERQIWWNFVSSSKERIEQAKRDWKERRFPTVPGDEVEFVPLP